MQPGVDQNQSVMVSVCAWFVVYVYIHDFLYSCIVCEDLNPIENGTVTYSQNGTVSGTVVTHMNGTVATYECNTTFVLVGNEMRTCLENATWSGSEPTCRDRGKYCNVPFSMYMHGA